MLRWTPISFFVAGLLGGCPGPAISPDVGDDVGSLDVPARDDVAAPDAPDAITCGDGRLDTTEACDDGGTRPDDGCDAACEVEDGWSCDGSPSTCTPVCGDGAVVGAEACDDGGGAPSDGCSGLCAVEPGWSCAGAPSACVAICGDGLVVDREACDDGGTGPADGCDALCAVETGWTCSGAPSACVAICGDGLVLGAEAGPTGCDDGNDLAGDGCSSCAVDRGYACSGAPSACSTGCGDGVIAGPEACDDGGMAAGDGCSPACAIEGGWTCAGEPSACTSRCGDGTVAAPVEACDDGNTAAGDGCHLCRVEAGWDCSTGICRPVCGDGRRLGAETCDDGDTSALDGCDASCVIETNWICSVEGSPCTCDRSEGPFGPTYSTYHVEADGDGFGDRERRYCVGGGLPRPDLTQRTGDCDDSDVLVHPYGYDVSGDGVDGDCDGTDASARPHQPLPAGPLSLTSFTFPLCGRLYGSGTPLPIVALEDGRVTLGVRDDDPTPTTTELSADDTVLGYWEDLVQDAESRIVWQEYPDAVAIHYRSVHPAADPTVSLTFSIVLFEDARGLLAWGPSPRFAGLPIAGFACSPPLVPPSSNLSTSSPAGGRWGSPLATRARYEAFSGAGFDLGGRAFRFQTYGTAVTFGTSTTARAGGSGGAVTVDDCPLNTALVGVQAGVGPSGWITRLGAICADARGVSGTGTVPGLETRLPVRGTGSDPLSLLYCPPNQFVVGIEGRSASYVDQLRLVCATVPVSTTFAVSVSTSTFTTLPVGGLGGTPFARISCGSGRFANGLSIASGAAIDSLALRCAVPGAYPW